MESGPALRLARRGERALQSRAMPLPILQAFAEPTPENLVRLFHRTELHWTRHLGEEAQLDFGTAFTNPALDRVAAANGMFDASLPEGTAPRAAVEEAEAHFAEQGVRCRQWVLNPAAPEARTRPLADHLLESGHRAAPLDIMHLSGRPAGVVREVAGLTIIPARASFRQVRALAEEALAPWNDPQLVESALLHLDDPHWDALLALREGKPVAHAGVLAAGDVGRIDQVYVSPEFRRRGIGRTMMGRALEICARSLFKHVMLYVNPASSDAPALYAQLGFRKIGQLVTYVRGE